MTREFSAIITSVTRVQHQEISLIECVLGGKSQCIDADRAVGHAFQRILHISDAVLDRYPGLDDDGIRMCRVTHYMDEANLHPELKQQLLPQFLDVMIMVNRGLTELAVSNRKFERITFDCITRPNIFWAANHIFRCVHGESLGKRRKEHSS